MTLCLVVWSISNGLWDKQKTKVIAKFFSPVKKIINNKKSILKKIIIATKSIATAFSEVSLGTRVTTTLEDHSVVVVVIITQTECFLYKIL